MKMRATVSIGRHGKGLVVVWSGVQSGNSLHNIYERLREKYPKASRIDLKPLDGSVGDYAIEHFDQLYGPTDEAPE